METDITLILRTLTPIVDILDQFALPYHVGGSVASSLYGQFRPTQDVDIVADIRLAYVRLFVKQLEEGYYVVEDMIREAIRRQSSFNLISNETFIKVDIFIPKSRAFDQDAVHGIRRQPLVEGGREFMIASPENIIVNKLEWYKMGGEVSTRQWNDILGILKRQGTKLDFAYLDRWSAALNIGDLLERALVEADLKQP
jgi:hypothetical protein